MAEIEIQLFFIWYVLPYLDRTNNFQLYSEKCAKKKTEEKRTEPETTKIAHFKIRTKRCHAAIFRKAPLNRFDSPRH